MTVIDQVAGNAAVTVWRHPSLRLWPYWLGALGAIAVMEALRRGAGLGVSLGDMDDATRLVEVRELMAGAPWFDTWTASLGGGQGMLSHWSRLIDLPIALLWAGFGLVLPSESAELAVRAAWPLAVLAPLLWVVARALAETGGQRTAVAGLLLLVFCPLGLYQFDIGRIDHHNAMIAATVSAALLMWAYPASARAWTAAGGLVGLSLAIGYEALAPAAILSIAVAILGFFRGDMSAVARHYLCALPAVLVLLFVATVPPARYLDVRCDALSLNLVVLVAAGSAGLWAAMGERQTWPLWKRLSLVLAAGGLGLLAFGLLEPKCLSGPMGQLEPELKTIWLKYTQENQSFLADIAAGDLSQSLALIIYFALGTWLAIGEARASRRPADTLLAVAVAGFVLLASWQYKYVAYASIIATVPLARAIASLPSWRGLDSRTVALAASILASQAILLGLFGAIQSALASPPPVRASASNGAAPLPRPEQCLESAPIRELAVLPPGLIAARIDIGAYIAALTHHRALSAPYHRIGRAIIANHRIFSARTPEAAATVLTAEKIDYVLTCRGLDDPYVGDAEWIGTLRADLVGGRPPAFLVPIALPNPDSQYKVWRVDRTKLPAGR
jgi:hypothetical protein